MHGNERPLPFNIIHVRIMASREESEMNGEDGEQFKEVNKKGKRKRRTDERDGEMETGEGEGDSAAKRPSFPPVDASTVMVGLLLSSQPSSFTLLTSTLSVVMHILYSVLSHQSFLMILPHTLFQGGRPEYRSVPVPPNRFSPLKEHWMKIFTPVVDHLKLQIRVNLKTKSVEIKVPVCTAKDLGLLTCGVYQPKSIITWLHNPSLPPLQHGYRMDGGVECFELHVFAAVTCTRRDQCTTVVQ